MTCVPSEHPILFKGPLVCQIMGDIKSETRRTRGLAQVNASPDIWKVGCMGVLHLPGNRHHGQFGALFQRENESVFVKSPYGRPGDRLWVRENTSEHVIGSESVTCYTADGAISHKPWWYSKRACPSIHMPRDACRLLLEVVDVRVERLQRITEQGAMAEGAEPADFSGFDKDELQLLDWPLKEVGAPYRNGFAMLWETVNGYGSWAKNPWVWVVAFRRAAA